MKKQCMFLALLVMLSAGMLSGQPVVVQAWHVADNGGGRSNAAGGFVLQASIGQANVAAMSGTGATLESGYIPGSRSGGGTSGVIVQSVRGGWNMVSVPAQVNDFHVTTLYPSAVSSAFDYAAGYQPQTILQAGVGYWLKFASDSAASISGTSVVKETVAVASGWNLIGTPSYPVPTGEIVPVGTSVNSNFFGYNGGYQIADTLEAGLAYWVRVTAAGQLILPTGSVLIPPGAAQKKTAGLNLSGVNTLTFHPSHGEGITLYYTFRPPAKNPIQLADLPPMPPDGGTEIRFATNRLLESASPSDDRIIPLVLSSVSYPLKISWKNREPGVAGLLAVGGKNVRLTGSGDFTISGPGAELKLILPRENGAQLPTVFGLDQNYPNPFNPATTIRYQLPSDSRVTLRVYDLLGRVVQTLAEGVQEAGYKQLSWNASNFASGLYFYRLEAASVSDHSKTFTEVKKMLLIR